MPEHVLPLTTFYKGWENYQQRLVEMIAPLSTEQLALRAGSHAWSIGLIAQHMIADRVWWFHRWMDEGTSELAPIAHWDPADDVEQAPLTATELVTGLESTWQMIHDALGRWTAGDLDEVISPPAAGSDEGLARLQGSGSFGMCSNTRSIMGASFPWHSAGMVCRGSTGGSSISSASLGAYLAIARRPAHRAGRCPPCRFL